jgi:hypothetical protein
MTLDFEGLRLTSFPGGASGSVSQSRLQHSRLEPR